MTIMPNLFKYLKIKPTLKFAKKNIFPNIFK